MPTLTICCGLRPYYLLEIPGQPLTRGRPAIVITGMTKRIEGLTAQGSQLFSALRELNLGPQATFNGTKLRISVYYHDEAQLERTVKAFQKLVGELEVTTKAAE